MYIAKELRKKSIAEYLLYMWQMEDLIRAYGCHLPLIQREYIAKFANYTDEQKEEETDWFGNLIRMMNEEGCREQGHLQINKVILQDMVDLHQRLLQSGKFPYYNARYYKVLPFIVELRSRNKRGGAPTEEESEIETCMDALYGKMMLQLQHKEITPATQAALREITTFVGMLSDYYVKDRDEGLKFDDDMEL